MSSHCGGEVPAWVSDWFTVQARHSLASPRPQCVGGGDTPVVVQLPHTHHEQHHPPRPGHHHGHCRPHSVQDRPGGGHGRESDDPCVLHRSVQYSTVQYSTVHYSTVHSSANSSSSSWDIFWEMFCVMWAGILLQENSFYLASRSWVIYIEIYLDSFL